MATRRKGSLLSLWQNLCAGVRRAGIIAARIIWGLRNPPVWSHPEPQLQRGEGAWRSVTGGAAIHFRCTQDASQAQHDSLPRVVFNQATTQHSYFRDAARWSYIHKPVHTEALMAATTKYEAKARTFGRNIESDLASRFLRVVENAAIASAHTMGQGERQLSDHVATEAMRKTMDSIPMRGTIVIGEGERDEAPMLYIGEKVGAEFPDGTQVPEVDIAVDPLEGTNLCATGAPGSNHRARRFGTWRLAQCSRLLHGKNCSRSILQGRCRS